MPSKRGTRMRSCSLKIADPFGIRRHPGDGLSPLCVVRETLPRLTFHWRKRFRKNGKLPLIHSCFFSGRKSGLANLSREGCEQNLKADS